MVTLWPGRWGYFSFATTLLYIVKDVPCFTFMATVLSTYAYLQTSISTEVNKTACMSKNKVQYVGKQIRIRSYIWYGIKNNLLFSYKFKVK